MKSYVFLAVIFSVFILSPKVTFAFFEEFGQCSFSGQIHYAPAIDPKTSLTAMLVADIAATQDFTNFCKWNRLDRQTGRIFNYELAEYRKAKEEDNLYKAVEILRPYAEEDSPWTSSMRGVERLKNQSGGSYFNDFGRVDHNPVRILNYINSFPEHSNYSFEDYNLTPYIPPGKKESLVSCRIFAIEDSICLKGTKELLSMLKLSRKGGLPILGKKIFKDLAIDPSLTNGLKSAAVKALEREISIKESKDDIYQLLFNSFKESGLNDEEATDKTWSSLYLYSVGGPNFSKRIQNYEISFSEDPENFNPNAVMGQALFETLPKLDGFNAREKSSVFSLPNGSNFPCDIGKSYHFWMSAFIAREMTKKGYSAEVAAKFAMMFAANYHLKPISFSDMKNLLGRKGGFRDYARFGTIENGMRFDLNLAAAGAVYGASNGQKVSDIQQGFRKSLKVSGMNPNGTEVNDNYKEWISRLRPEEILKIYMN